jgi:hypothetical protein
MSEQSIYHDKCILLASLFNTDAGKKLLEEFVQEKSKLLDKIARSESGIEVSAVEQKSNSITVVILNKDEIQHELKFIKKWEAKFAEWKEEARKRRGQDE